jgi:3',5'-cyclic AMP phosphodiesterase CpdA
MTSRRKPLHTILLLPLLLSWLFAPISLGAVEYRPFAVISDTHLGQTETVFITFLKAFDAQDINLLFHTGDAIYNPGSDAQWKKFFELVGPDRTIHIAPGNHDINDRRSLTAFERNVRERPYHSVSLGDTQFILLCTEFPDEAARIAGKQLEWLRDELEKPFRFRFIFLHRPLFPTAFGKGYCLDRYPEDRDGLHRLFVKAGVSVVFAGHEHLYKRIAKDGITYVTGGGAGAQLIAFTEESGGFHHYIVAKRRNEGYLFSVCDLRGNTRDEFSINK